MSAEPTETFSPPTEDTVVDLLSTLDVSRLLKLVSSASCLAMEARTCVVRLFDPATGKFAIRDVHGAPEGDDAKALFRLDTKVVTEVVRMGDALRVGDLAQDDAWREFDVAARTFLCMPLRDEGRVLGTVGLYGRVTRGAFEPEAFSAADSEAFSRFTRHVERVVANANALEEGGIDAVDVGTGLPTLPYFRGRLTHEVARARRFKRRLVLMICEVVPGGGSTEDGIEAFERGAFLERRIAKVVRAGLRDYDIVAKIADGRFGMILPEAEDGTVSAIPRVRRAVEAEIEEIRRKVPSLSTIVRFGHAAFPDDGEERDALIFKANRMEI